MHTSIRVRDLKSLIDRAAFRSSRTYQLVELSAIPADQRATLGPLADESGCFGLRTPSTSAALVPKTVGEPTARLLKLLAEGRRLPPEAAAQPSAIAGLVLDGVLDIDAGSGFVGGPGAAPLMVDVVRAEGWVGRLGHLSAQALALAEATNLADYGVLMGLLYQYNTEPIAPRLLEKLSHPDTARLPRVCANAITAVLRDSWLRIDPQLTPGWLCWRPQGRLGPTPFKVYVSPAVEHTREAVTAVASVLAEGPVAPFKVGGDLPGLVRPDKIVIYLDTLESARTITQRILTRLDGCPVQGVPFTAELGGDGLVSWGMDPPKSESSSWLGPDSWRIWVARKLAGALISALSSGPGPLDPRQFALARIALDGVDALSWAPDRTIWREP